MKPITAKDPESHSPDLVGENLARLRALFPEAFTEGQVNFEVLKQLLGGAVDERDEKYGLNWHGKRQARQLALTPSTGTLRPCPEESVDWDATQNLMIEGDNLEVLKLLQKSYAGKVKLIYIDPPYNTGKDFIYPDDFRDNIKNYLELTGQTDGEGRKLSTNTEASGRFHTAWLNMMYPRLKLARNLLRDDGIIAVSTDDHEGANLSTLLEDIFGGENFVVCVAWEKRVSPANDAKWFSTDHDLLWIVAKTKSSWRPLGLPRGEDQLAYYRNPDADPRGPWNSVAYTCNKSRDQRPNLYYPILNPYTGKEVWPKPTAVWKYGLEVTNHHRKDGRLYWGADGAATSPRLKLFLSESDPLVPRSVWSSRDAGSTQEATTELLGLFDGQKTFDSPKPVRLIRRIAQVAGCAEGDLILDFFAGSGTTGHAVLAQNAADGGTRRYILVQLPEPTGRSDYGTIADICKERLRRAGAKVRSENPMFAGDLGFRVFKLDSSNLKAWDPVQEDLPQEVQASIEHLKADRSEQDILYEVLLKLGLDLSLPIEEQTIAGKAVQNIGAGTLFACLAPTVAPGEVEPLALGIASWRQELAPAGNATVIFRDSAFADDVAKTNCTAILKQHGFEEDNIRSL
ncbi:MAG TPA: site-specific DNA-methyltransferase [Terriglobales bacterium]|nr:site-specific DNA-methyltransferase [Terriglobales bacterium]